MTFTATGIFTEGMSCTREGAGYSFFTEDKKRLFIPISDWQEKRTSQEYKDRLLTEAINVFAEHGINITEIDTQ